MRRAGLGASWFGYTPPSRNKVCCIMGALCKLFVVGKDPKTVGEIFGRPVHTNHNLEAEKFAHSPVLSIDTNERTAPMPGGNLRSHVLNLL
jgi:hypothetical protein